MKKNIVLLLSPFCFLLICMLMISVSASAQGHYRKGSRSSHKGGYYKNASTHDHYRKDIRFRSSITPNQVS